MTSEGSARVVPSYGVVSSAKAALELHVRQLAMEMARLDTGIAVNALQAGVTDTPALRKIPEAAPHGRDHPGPQRPWPADDDPGRGRCDRHAVRRPNSDWVSGNIIRADGGGVRHRLTRVPASGSGSQ